MPNSMINEPIRTNMANQQQIVQPVEQLPVRNTQAAAIMNGSTNSANRMQGNRIGRTYVPTITESVQDRMRKKRKRMGEAGAFGRAIGLPQIAFRMRRNARGRGNLGNAMRGYR